MSRYGFIVSAVKNRLSGGKAAYAARMRHMGVIRGEQLFKEFGEYMAMNPTLAKNLVNGLGGYIRQQLLHGYKLDFGVFKVGLTIRGGFDAANDKFDPEKNTVCVSLTPSMDVTACSSAVMRKARRLSRRIQCRSRLSPRRRALEATGEN